MGDQTVPKVEFRVYDRLPEEAAARSEGVPHVWMSKGLGAGGDER